jgi:hypothetical protein
MPQCPTLASPMRVTAADIYLSANRRTRIQARFMTARAPLWVSAATVVIIGPIGSRGNCAEPKTLAKSRRAVVNFGSRVTGAEISPAANVGFISI